MLSFFFERIGHATADVLPARELNDRAALFSHFGSADTRTPPEGLPSRGAQGGGSGTLLSVLLELMDFVEGSASQTHGACQRFLTERPARPARKACAPGNA